MPPHGRRATLARHTRVLAMVLEALVVLSLLVSSIPIAIAQPVWWLRLSDASLNLAPVVLVAVILLPLGRVLVDNGLAEAQLSDRRGRQLATRWALIFALLVPLQLIGYVWLWTDSNSQLNREIHQTERRLLTMRDRILASSSEAALQDLVAASNPGPLPALPSGSLAEQKRQLSEAMAINASRFSSGLRDQRNSMLLSTLPGTLRVLAGAVIVSAFLFLLRREI